VFFLHISAGSNSVLCSTREKLTQSTFTRLIYITRLSHTYILFFSIITINLPDLLKLLANQKPTRTIHLQLKNIVSRNFSMYCVRKRHFLQLFCLGDAGTPSTDRRMNRASQAKHAYYCFGLCRSDPLSTHFLFLPLPASPPPPCFVAVVGNLYSSRWIQAEYAANHAASAGAALLKKHMHI